MPNVFRVRNVVKQLIWTRMGVMVCDLEIQKVVNSVESVTICCRDADSPTSRQLLKGVRDVRPPVLHLGCSRRNLTVNEHRDREVTI